MMSPKELAAARAVEYVKDGMTIGLGTGSTAYWAIKKIGEKANQGLQIKAIATSIESERLALESGIPIIQFTDIEDLDLTIDGADEVDKNKNLIKGGGGALLREKIIASITRHLIIIADESKIVDTLGQFPLPVEVVQFGWEISFRQLASLGCIPELRRFSNEPRITDNGNFIIDCHFGEISDPGMLEQKINLIPGVVENGLFVNRAERIIVGYKEGIVKEF